MSIFTSTDRTVFSAWKFLTEKILGPKNIFIVVLILTVCIVHAKFHDDWLIDACFEVDQTNSPLYLYPGNISYAVINFINTRLLFLIYIQINNNSNVGQISFIVQTCNQVCK